jgi:hypothetical protein
MHVFFSFRLLYTFTDTSQNGFGSATGFRRLESLDPNMVHGWKDYGHSPSFGGEILIMLALYHKRMLFVIFIA